MSVQSGGSSRPVVDQSPSPESGTERYLITNRSTPRLSVVRGRGVDRALVQLAGALALGEVVVGV
ncbi:hypothetical protein, partial [Halorubrum sp. AJ67]|uniref:hypothetical protein n=1 Tax=Halorubrum sp. AJ67 TaxID=1173487 RepID=UPI001E4DFC6C